MKTRIAFGIVAAVALVVTAVLSGPQLVANADGALASVAASPSTVAAVLLAVGLQVLGHVLRCVKHRQLLNGIRPIGFLQVFRGQMIGFAFSALLPFRVGDIVRAHYVGRAVQISRAAVFATILFERIFDLGVVLAAAAVALALSAWPPTQAFVLLLVVSVGALTLLVALLAVCGRQPRWFLTATYRSTELLNPDLRDRARHIVWSFSHALSYALPSRTVVARYVGLSVLMWMAYLGSIGAVVVAVLGAVSTPGGAVGTVVTPYLGVSTWLGPAYFGEYLTRAQGVLGAWVAGGSAASFILIAWCLLIVPSVIIGVFCLLHRQLVEHIDGVTPTALTRSKLFREEDTSSEFAHLLAAHYEGNALGRIVSREESAGRFTVLRALKGGSHASTLLVWQGGEVVVKKVTLKEHRSKLDSQFEWLAARADSREIVDVVGRYDGGDHFDIDIAFREGTVPYFEYLHASSKDAAWAVLQDVIGFMEARVYQPIRIQGRERILDQYLATKVSQKVLDTAAVSPTVSQLLGYDRIVVNGAEYANLPATIEQIRDHAAATADLCDFQHETVHGDLTIDNLMVDPASGSFMIIDPNDENLISDRLVDYGKILQSLHSGYEFLVENHSVSVDGPRVSFEERRSAQYEYLYSRATAAFHDLLEPGRGRALLFHEAVHYCRMLTYRAAIDQASVAIYYAIATRLFNEFLAQYDAVGARSSRRPVRVIEPLAAKTVG